MPRTLIRELAQHIGQDVTIQGWVHTIRDQKSIAFIIVRDHTGMVQVTIDKPNAERVAAVIPTLTRESTVTVSGRVSANTIVKLGGIEIHPTEFRVEGAADPNLPLDPQAKVAPNVDVRMDWRFLDLRRPENYLAFQVETTALAAMHEFWKRENFIELQTPKLLATASESGAELFSLEYFGRPAYLAQSPQFYKQMAMAAGFEKVFEVGQVFRANPSFTSRHDTEFTMYDMRFHL